MAIPLLKRGHHLVRRLRSTATAYEPAAPNPDRRRGRPKCYGRLNSIAATLPWFEVFCGLLLVAGVAVRGSVRIPMKSESLSEKRRITQSALMLLLMLVPFTFVVLQRALAIHAALGIPFCAVKFDCGCGAGEIIIYRKLVENGVLILLSGWLLMGRGRHLCARYSLLASEE